ncbi:MAG: threonylcarbamoyl-AMP synthase [Chlorobi bacterium]|nr:threonylcarbamoyl-AMP synthase [Chlorobiota bacterium]
MNEDINKAVQILQKGGIILYPADTIWGLGCDAVNENAVARLFEIKKRQKEKSMLILLNNPSLIYSYVEKIPDTALDIIEISQKPITIIYPGAKNLAPGLIAEDGSIGIRITQEEFTYKLLQKFKKPLVSTSANIAGEKTPLNFNEISDEIKEKVDYIVKYRQNEKTNGVSSSIIKLGLNNEVKVIRE